MTDDDSPGPRRPRPPAADETDPSDRSPASSPTKVGLATAMGWAYAMDIGAQVLGALITFVLAALLGPDEFGLVALALVYVMFIDMLQRQGLSSAIVQRRDLQRDHLNTAFWLIVVLTLALTAASVSLSGWWAASNNTPQLRIVIIWMSALLPIQGLILVQEAILRRDMRFRPLALRNTIAAVTGGTLGVIAAFAGFGVWALVIQQVGTALTKLLVLWSVTDWRPEWRFSRRHLHDLLSFSTGSFLTSVAVFVNARADALFVGMFFGPAAIGLYRFAHRMMSQVLAVSLSGPSMITVALPALSRRQDDPAAFTRELDRLVHIAVVSSFPLFGILAAVAQPLMRVVGDQWVPAATAVQLLCLVGCAQAISALVQPVLQALGHPHRQAILTWVLAAFSAASFIAVGIALRDQGLVRQVTLMATSRAIVYAGILMPTTLWVFAHYGDLHPTRVLRISAPAAVSAGAGWLAGTMSGSALGWGGSRLMDFALLAVTGATATLAAGGVLLGTDKTARQLLASRWSWLRALFHDHQGEPNSVGRERPVSPRR